MLPPQWRFGSSYNVKKLGRLDIPGGGQVVVQDGYAYVGHMLPPLGTSIVDVRDPKNPRIVAQFLPPPPVCHIRRGSGVTVCSSLIRRSCAALPTTPTSSRAFAFSTFESGNPRLVSTWKCAGVGVHRFDIDDRYAYLAAELEGFRGRIVTILDLKNPERPEEVGHWWMKGQWAEGGEEPTWPGRRHRCHHPLRRGDRLYTSYWHGGFVILDISEPGATRPVCELRARLEPALPMPDEHGVADPWDEFMGRSGFRGCAPTRRCRTG